jgi:sulfate transport system permease protein
VPRRSHHVRRRRALPGFGLSLGFAMMYLSVVVLIPLSSLFVESARMGWGGL